ncbi:TldD/PmbA family protein [Amycolatopsis silviterrae]|uniref:TldD/PmbA family protein n=1 Tax=Amycolatopsis silviterrae TaxID=1656914 RepID=A0ABW5HGG0_9PSEU
MLDSAAGIDPAFVALPLARLADAALGQAQRRGIRHASVSVVQVRTAASVTQDGVLRGSKDTTDTGLAVRLRSAGNTGFAATAALTPEAAASTVDDAIAVAEAGSVLLPGAEPPPAAERVHRGHWSTPHRIDPFSVPAADRVAKLTEWSARLAKAPQVGLVLAKVTCTRDSRFYADLAGTTTLQQRLRIHPQVVAACDGASLRSQGPPTARGWEYLEGEGWDWDAEIEAMPALLSEKRVATPVEPGCYDLVIDPSQLWLTIHESVGHATELDRALGHETAYAGTTFVSPDQLGSLRYGSALMNVDADRIAPHSLATTGFDDEGVKAQRWPLIEKGVLTGFQTDRTGAALLGADRSTGCSHAESALHVPIQRMPNVSLLPAPDGPDTARLIDGVGDGIYLTGSDSFSIDARREDFQFSAQRAYRIRRGRLAGQLSGVAYLGRTRAFWGALGALGGQDTYRTFGADRCGKGQPVQAAAASHGSPAAAFAGIRVTNTAAR